MKRLDVRGGAAVFFAAIDFYRSGFAQLDRNDSRRRIGAEKQRVFFESHQPANYAELTPGIKFAKPSELSITNRHE